MSPDAYTHTHTHTHTWGTRTHTYRRRLQAEADLTEDEREEMEMNRRLDRYMNVISERLRAVCEEINCLLALDLVVMFACSP